MTETTTNGPAVVIPESRTVAWDTQTFTFAQPHVCRVPWRDVDGYFNDPTTAAAILNFTIRFGRWVHGRPRRGNST